MIRVANTLFSTKDIQSIHQSKTTDNEYVVAVTLTNGNTIKNITNDRNLKNHWLKLLRGEYNK